MSSVSFPRPRAWAQQQFGQADLGDKRRTRRLVDMAARMMRRPSASLPAQMASNKALDGAYHLIDSKSDEVTYSAIIAPHFQQTREAAGRERVVLMIQDTTQIDHTHHPTTADLGPVGTGAGRGYLLQSVLAVVPKPRRVLGLAYQEPFLRKPAPPGETRDERRKRDDRESQVWARAARAVGGPPAGALWVHVGDAYSDIYEYMEACRQDGGHFLIRAAQQRRVAAATTDDDPDQRYLLSFARRLSGQDERVIELPARDKKPARKARVKIAFSPLTIKAPSHGLSKPGIDAWVIRVWEPEPPAEVDEPVDWILITSVPTLTLEDAWERTEWYACRWMIEDYHMCLKTGCRIERRRRGNGVRLMRLLGVLAPVAVRLLQLRELARLDPECLAYKALPADLVAVVASLADLPAEELTLASFWREVAREGGYLGRRHDGPPGWQTLWAGWLHIQTLLEGLQLASRLPPIRCA